MAGQNSVDVRHHCGDHVYCSFNAAYRRGTGHWLNSDPDLQRLESSAGRQDFLRLFFNLHLSAEAVLAVHICIGRGFGLCLHGFRQSLPRSSGQQPVLEFHRL